MIDYQALRAIDAVLQLQSFEKAALRLSITQSAISQRIGNFESLLGEKLLIRKLPYTPTDVCCRYLTLLRKVNLLEDELQDVEHSSPLKSIKLAINKDSLDLWFYHFFDTPDLAGNILLEIIPDDQDLTLGYIKSGKSDICISSVEKPLPKYRSTFLGNMKYVMACTPAFKSTFFKVGFCEEAIAITPAIIFNEKDRLHHKYLKQFYHYRSSFPHSAVPSTRGFKKAITSGFGYGLLPVLDVEKELKQKTLVSIDGSNCLHVPLYLHHWAYLPKTAARVVEQIIQLSKFVY